MAVFSCWCFGVKMLLPVAGTFVFILNALSSQFVFSNSVYCFSNNFTTGPILLSHLLP